MKRQIPRPSYADDGKKKIVKGERRKVGQSKTVLQGNDSRGDKEVIKEEKIDVPVGVVSGHIKVRTLRGKKSQADQNDM